MLKQRSNQSLCPIPATSTVLDLLNIVINKMKNYRYVKFKVLTAV
jgi:hypothetical protein